MNSLFPDFSHPDLIIYYNSYTYLLNCLIISSSEYAYMYLQNKGYFLTLFNNIPVLAEENSEINK